jgi:phytoene dehydrogenase-like protein
MEKSIAIIGAGIAGLSAGCYARMNGFKTTIFELHDKPGGLCTSWERDGYTIDGCLHWLVGSSPTHSFHQIWRELGALHNTEVYDYEEFFRIEGSDGKTLVFHTDIDRLEEHLLQLSPSDGGPIRRLCRTARLFSQVDTTSSSFRMTFNKTAKLLPFLLRLLLYRKISVQEYARKFQDPFLRRAFVAAFDLPDFPILALAFVMSWIHNRTAGYPLGGSLEFSRRIEKRFVSLGGQISYQSRVEKILVKKGRAVGVRLQNGEEHRADFVISAADGHATLFEMLGESLVDARTREQYQTLKPFPPLVYVGMGLDTDMTGLPHNVHCLLDTPIRIAGVTHDKISFRHYCYDPSLAPAGKSVVVTMLTGDYDYWRDLAGDPARYESEKRLVCDQVIDLLERRFPETAGRVDMVDVATPLTFERYTGNWRGSFEGWLMTTGTIFLRMKKQLPGLKNFYMIGQWTQPGGGVPTGGMHGKNIIRRICKEAGIRFATSTP